MKENFIEYAKIFKALSDPKRLAVLDLLKDDEKCACVLQEELHTTQSGLAYHMKVLCDAGIIDSWPVGKWTHYCISQTGCEEIVRILGRLTGTTKERKIQCFVED